MTSAGLDEPRGHSGIPGLAKILIFAQATVNLFLSLWIYEEYLNNQYLRAYVNDSLQTGGWLVAVLIVTLALGATTTVLFRRKKNIMEKVEAASTEVKVPVDVPVASPKPSEAFHPIVASLKAELSHGPVPIGIVPVSKKEEATASAGGEVSVVTGPGMPTVAEAVPATPVVKKAEPEKPAEAKPSSQYEDKSTSQ